MTEPGALLGGRYQLDQIIGRGGMAEVWRAHDTRLSRDVAVKRLRIDLASDPTFQARFRREAQSAAGLNHPNIVAVYDTGEERDDKSDVMVPFIVMELVEGVTLREVLRDGRRILPARALEFTSGVLDALSYSHRAGIIHRDIKPANVMLTPQGSVKVMDFGIARAVADTSATMTQTAAVIGTAQYLSPEQARGEKVDSRSDIYSVGCLLYELLVGEPPFKGDSPVSVAYQHVREAPVPPSQRDPEVTPAMDAITLKALNKDPRDRYQDAAEFRDDIAAALAGRPVAAMAASIPAEAATQVIASDPLTTTARRAALPTAVVPAAGGGDVEEPEDEEERPKRTGLKATLIILSVLLVAALSGAVYMILNPSAPTQVTVPKVAGFAQDAAEEALENLELVAEVVPQADPEVKKGDAIGTNPRDGESVEKGATVQLFISTGPGLVKIPTGLEGLTFKQAEAKLKEANLKAEKAEEASDEIEKGRVIRSEPAEGREVAPESSVKIVVSTGPAEVAIPEDLEGLTFQEASDILEDLHFKVEQATESSDSVDEDRVIRTDPTPGTSAAYGSTVTVTVSTGAATVQVPNLINSTADQAAQALKDAGFDKAPKVTTVLNGNETEGLVFWQSRSQGESVSPDTVIEINVAIAPQEPDPSETPDPDPGEDPDPDQNPDQNPDGGEGE